MLSKKHTYIFECLRFFLQNGILSDLLQFNSNGRSINSNFFPIIQIPDLIGKFDSKSLSIQEERSLILFSGQTTRAES